MNEQETVFLNPEEAAELIKVHVSTIYRYIELPEDALPCNRISPKKILIKKSDLISWVESHFHKPEDDAVEGGEK